MWILIEVDKPNEVGLNEKRRIKLGDDNQVERNVLPYLFAEGEAIEVTPIIGGISSSDLLRKMIG